MDEIFLTVSLMLDLGCYITGHPGHQKMFSLGLVSFTTEHLSNIYLRVALCHQTQFRKWEKKRNDLVFRYEFNSFVLCMAPCFQLYLRSQFVLLNPSRNNLQHPIIMTREPDKLTDDRVCLPYSLSSACLQLGLPAAPYSQKQEKTLFSWAWGHDLAPPYVPLFYPGVLFLQDF